MTVITNSRTEEVVERYKVALTALEEATSLNKGIVETDWERQRRQRQQRKKPLTKVRKARGLPSKRDKSAYHIPHSNILDVLKARDAVQEILEDKTQDSSGKLINIVKLDQRLKKQAKSIVRAVNLDDWRASFNPPDHAWWWFLEQRFGLWSSLLSILCLVLSLSFIGDIAPRFLTGGPELWGNIVVILQGIFVLITGRSVFSHTAGRKLANVFPRKFWDKWGTRLALLSLAFSVLLYQSLPQIAVYYRDLGLSDYEAGRLASAQSNYKRALALNPNDSRAHFYLGSLYEEFQDFNGAGTEYQTAIRSNLAEAFNNMARLYILEENYATAIVLLRRLKAMITPEDDMMLHYNLHKNLGWVYLKRRSLAEAEAELLTAIEDIAKPAKLSPERQASAHCLLAQVLDEKGDIDQANLEWQYCLRYASGLLPDEAAWLKIAQERLTSQEFPQVQGGKF
ncbi:MAG: tetratricopeptide repeat protein [Prochloraceae cyanobacterium]